MSLHTLWLQENVEAALRADREAKLLARAKDRPEPMSTEEMMKFAKKHGPKAATREARKRAKIIKRFDSPRSLTMSNIVNEILTRHYKLEGSRNGKRQ